MELDTIEVDQLPEEIQEEIGSYPEDIKFAFFVRREDNEIVQLAAIEPRLVDLFHAQRDPQEEWLKVNFQFLGDETLM